MCLAPQCALHVKLTVSLLGDFSPLRVYIVYSLAKSLQLRRRRRRRRRRCRRRRRSRRRRQLTLSSIFHSFGSINGLVNRWIYSNVDGTQTRITRTRNDSQHLFFSLTHILSLSLSLVLTFFFHYYFVFFFFTEVIPLWVNEEALPHNEWREKKNMMIDDCPICL